MKPHSPDPISLISGLTFSIVAIGFGLANTSDHLRWLFVIPLVLIVGGGGILAVAARRLTAPSEDSATIDANASAAS